MVQNASPQLLTIERLWQFSLQYYSVREVKEACLTLQNRFHGNVNLLMLFKWLDEQHLTFQEQEWHKIESCLARSETLLNYYREIRKQYKEHLPDTLYRKSLEFELLLEKQQQADLVECINSLTLSENNRTPLTTVYCQHLGAAHLAGYFSEAELPHKDHTRCG
ncbi:TIGR02444 family protein [Vibrio sp. JC009]|uniref:TIGR02444 family protein n=1 Tax=Vibrio sp. JC009 TaxID=2912314 RepID=UPI0023AFCD45|nr:TIGR02444 family protein [Vibrio sp. JC009]WED22072.1 TIGR02444 family protein [Vibrio sp. JC009]